MKTKTCILVCLLLSFGLAQVIAQKSNAKDTKSIQYWYESTYWAPVFCGGEFKELLEGGKITVHVVLHYKDGIALWEKDQIKGEVTSETGEVFQIRGELDKWYYVGDDLYLTWHNNLIGNWGTHYIGDVTVNWTQWIFYPGNNRCL